MSVRMKTVAAAAFALAGSTAWAQSAPPEGSVSALASQADLVFQGTVTNLEYAPSIEGIPHTFVTYRVEEVLKGAYSGRTLTLRFIGGEIVKDGVLRRLSVSHSPTFAAGQQDLLMVKGNASTQCPLVRCARGRFRFEHGVVTDEEGSALALGESDELVTLFTAPAAGAGDIGPGERVAVEADPLATPLDRASFVAHVREAVGRLSGRSTTRVQSADPSKPFSSPSPVASRPPRLSAPSQSPVAAQLSERDRAELEALERNGGNPVLPVSEAEQLRSSREPARR